MASQQEKSRQALYYDRRAVERAELQSEQQEAERAADELEQKYAKKQRNAERTRQSRQRAANLSLGSTCGTTDLHASAMF